MIIRYAKIIHLKLKELLKWCFASPVLLATRMISGNSSRSFSAFFAFRGESTTVSGKFPRRLHRPGMQIDANCIWTWRMQSYLAHNPVVLCCSDFDTVPGSRHFVPRYIKTCPSFDVAINLCDIRSTLK